MIQSNIKLKGEPSAQALASGLATLGRYGDNYMVHAAEGETFVPKEILDANPDLKNQLFNQMKSMGIEEPNRYVVGDALNSINPVTGQPEFFFKKIFRAVKKVFKKVLPIAAPIIGNLIAPGIGGIIASGLVTKMQGGSWGDALKSAGLSYVGGAAMRGIQGGIGTLGNPNASFFGELGSGFQSGLTEPFSAAKGLFASGSENTLSQGIFGGLGSASGNITSGSYFNPTTASGSEKGFMDYLAPKYDPTGGVSSVNGMKTGFGEPSTGQGQSNPQSQGIQKVSASQNINDYMPPENAVFNETTGRYEMNQSGNINAAPKPSSTGQLINRPDLSIKPPSLEGSEFISYDPASVYNNPTPPPQGIPGYPNVEAGDVSQSALNTADKIYDKALDKAYVGGKFVDGELLSRSDALQQSLVGSTAKPELSFWDNVKEKALSKEVLGPVLAAGAPAALTYFTADEPTKDQEEGFTNPQKTAYSQYLSGKSSDPNFPQTPEGQRLRSIFMGPAPRTAEQLSRSTGVSLADAQSFVRNRYGIPAALQMPAAGLQMASVNNQGSPIQLGGGMPPGLMAAAGGEITGPGSGTSDSIPAMLSDGEFVMTAQAVRNAGNGNRDLGAARMYDMMGKFERAV